MGPVHFAQLFHAVNPTPGACPSPPLLDHLYVPVLGVTRYLVAEAGCLPSYILRDGFAVSIHVIVIVYLNDTLVLILIKIYEGWTKKKKKRQTEARSW